LVVVVSVVVTDSGGSTLGARGAQAPKSCPAPPPKFLDTVVLLLVELIGSIVISLSLSNDEGPGPPNIFS